MEFALQVAIILICLFYGARKGGVALGLLGGIGIVILVFVFKLPPGKPPVDVMLTIIAVVAASATLQASGGLDVMLQLAEKVLRRNPEVRLDPGAVHDLRPDHAVRHRARRVHDAADHLRRRNQEQHPARAADGGLLDRQPDGDHGQPGVGGGGVAGRLPGEGARRAHVIDFVTLLSITIPSTLLVC